MHVAIRLGRQPSGGMRALVRNLSEGLEALEAQVTYLAVGRRWESLDGAQVEFGAQSVAREYVIDSTEMGRWVADAGVDALLCPGNQVARTGGRTIWWPLTVAPYEAMALRAVAEGRFGTMRWEAIRRLLSLSARVADASIFSSNYAHQLYLASIGSDRRAFRRVSVVHPTTSIEIGPNVPSADPYLLTVSNFNRYKFVEEMLRGFAASSLREDGWAFKLAGNFPVSDYETAVRRTLAELELGSQVELLGGQTPDELPAIYAGASAFIFASTSENAASYTVIDAVAYGLPTVSSFYSSTPEVLGNAVRYFDPFSVEDVAANLSALNDATERGRLSRAARARSEQLNTWTTVASELLDLARRLDR